MNNNISEYLSDAGMLTCNLTRGSLDVGDSAASLGHASEQASTAQHRTIPTKLYLSQACRCERIDSTCVSW